MLFLYRRLQEVVMSDVVRVYKNCTQRTKMLTANGIKFCFKK